MEYLYDYSQAQSENMLIRHIYFNIIESLKRWTSKYDVPGMDVKLVMKYDAKPKVNQSNEEWVRLYRCRFELMRNDDEDTFPAFEVWLSFSNYDPDDINSNKKYTINVFLQHESIIIRMSKNDEGNLRIISAIASLDDTVQFNSLEDASSDCKSVYKVIRETIDDVMLNQLRITAEELDPDDMEDF